MISAKYIKNTLYTMTNTLVTLLFSVIISSVLVARYLGPDNYGVFAYSMSLAAIATAICALGIDTIAIKYANRESEKSDAYYRYAHSLKFMAGLAATAILFSFALTNRNMGGDARIVLAILSLVPLLRSWSTFQARLTTELNSKVVFKNNIVVVVTGTMCRILIVVLELPWMYFALCVLVDLLLHAILSEIANRKLHGYSVKQWDFASLPRRRILIESGPLFITGLFNVLYLRIDQLILYQLTSPSVVADYSIAVKWTESWYFIPAAIVSSSVGKLFKEADSMTQRRRYSVVFNLIGSTSLAFALLMLLLGGYLISILYGQTYAGSVAPLRILAFSGIVATLGSAWSTNVISMGQQKVLPFLLGVSTLGNIVLNVILIPQYAAVGAAYATVAANALPLVVIGLRNQVLRESTIIMLKASTGIPGIREIGNTIRMFRKKKEYNG